MPKAVKKKNQQKPSKDPLGHQIWFKTKEEGAGLPCVSFKNQSTSWGSEDRREPSFRFAFNGIHKEWSRQHPRQWSQNKSL